MVKNTKIRNILYSLFVVVMVGLIIYGILIVHRNANSSVSTFTNDGYALYLTPNSIKASVSPFKNGNQYAYKKYGNKVSINANDGNVTVDDDAIIHYQNGNLVVLKNTVGIDLDTLNDELILYYNLFKNTEIKRDQNNGYFVEAVDKKVNYKKLLLRINDDKYLLAGNNVRAMMFNEQIIDFGNYLYFEYVNGSIIKIYNHDKFYQTVSSDTKLVIDDITIDLKDKVISKNNVPKITLSNLVIDMDGNIDVITEEAEVNKQKIEKPKIDKDILTPPDNGNENSGVINENESVNDKKYYKEPVFKVTSLLVTALKIDANIEIFDEDGLLIDPVVFSIVENATATKVYEEELRDGNYHIYASGIDTINLEFDKISNDLSFTYKLGDKEETINVDRRVYTLHYDYNSDIVITLRNIYEEKVINLTKDDLAKTIAIYNNNYYYIKDNKLYNGDNLVTDNALHIYNSLVLLNNNSVYNLETNNTQNLLQNNNLIVNTIPLYQATVEGNVVYTYYNFTEIIDINNEVTIRDNQLIYKDGRLYIINSSDKDNSSIIVNNYNGNEYQMILGLDNEIYSYKTSLDMNSAFINANIKEITADFNSDLPIIMVRYNNDEILVLNYYNGAKLYSIGESQNISLTSFIGLSLRSNDLSSGNSTYNTNNNLNDSLNNLNDKEISEILNTVTSTNNNNNNSNSETEPVDTSAIVNNNTVNTRYIVSYNEYKNEYEIYNVDDVLFGDSPITINSKINSNKALYNYFYNNTKINDILKDNRVIIYIAIIALIIVNLIYVVTKYKRKGVGNE